MNITLCTTLDELLRNGLITNRIYNALTHCIKREDNLGYKFHYGQYATVRDIVNSSYEELSEIRNLGATSLNDLCAMLREHGLSVDGYLEAIDHKNDTKQDTERMAAIKEYARCRIRDGKTFEAYWGLVRKSISIYRSTHDLNSEELTKFAFSFIDKTADIFN